MNNRTKLGICIVSADSPYNLGTADGFQTYIKNLGEKLVRNGHEVLVYAFSRKVSIETQIKSNGVDYWCLPDKGYGNLTKNFLLLKFFFQFRKIKQKYNIELINGQGGYAFPAIFLRNVAKIATIHGSEPFWQTGRINKFFRIWFGRIIYSRMDGIVYICKAIEKAAESHYPKIKNIPRLVVYPPVLVPAIPAKKNKSNKIKIIAAGRLERIKNFAALSQSFNSIKKRFPNLTLEIYGNGREKNKLQPYAKGYLPHRKLMLKLIQSDIVILPSFSEVMPNIILESMSYGKVAIIGEWATSKELIEDSKNGYIIKRPGNSKEITWAIEEALKEHTKWPKIGKNAKATIKEKFNSEQNIRKLIKFYNLVLKK